MGTAAENKNKNVPVPANRAGDEEMEIKGFSISARVESAKVLIETTGLSSLNPNSLNDFEPLC